MPALDTIIDEFQTKFADDPYYSTLEVEERDDGYAIAYFVEWVREYELFGSFLSMLADEAAAESLVALEVTGTDEGVNGTRAWDLAPLVAGDTTFPHLKTVSFEGTKPGHHNRTIVTADDPYEEKGVIAKLLRRAPMLEHLEVPSAPNADFFAQKYHPLTTLAVQTGYDTQDLIYHFSHSTCFPELEKFEFTDYSETYMDNYESLRTPTEHWYAFFETDSLPALRHLTIINSALSPKDMAALRNTPLGEQLVSFEVKTVAL